MQTEREDSGAPECQRREIKIPRKRACRGFYFSRPIRVANTFLSSIRVNPINPWLGSLQPRNARGLLKNYPEVRLEISESGHGLMLFFLKVAPQPKSQQVTDQVTDEVLRLVSVIRGQMSRSEIQVLLGLRHLPHLRNAYLKPAIQHGLLEMTIPDKPQSRIQKYQLTPAGKTLAVAITSKK
jgi:hypothetical protein